VVKRLFDVVASSILIMILCPLFIVLAVLVKISSPGPVFFRQVRIGWGGEPFYIIKLRTMLADSEKLSRETAGGSDVRITPFGRFLRKYKLDELPQLFNVLTGDMSLVGPRPEIPFYAARYRGEERIVFSVRPGITDVCSLEFSDLDSIMDARGESTPAEYYEKVIHPRKKEIQMRYVKEQTFLSDLRILFKTAWVVLLGKKLV